MEKKLIIEINRSKELMGLIIESSNVFGLTDDVVTRMLSRFGKSNAIIRNELEQLQRIASGKLVKTPNEVADLLSSLMSKSKKIEQFLVPKLVDNSTLVQNEISNITNAMQNFKKDPNATYQKTLDNIKQIVPVRISVPQQIKRQIENEVIKRLNRNAYELWYPAWAKAEKVFDMTGGDFVKGFQKGINSKSGGFIFLKQVGKGAGYVLTAGKLPKWWPRAYRNLNSGDRKILWNWMISGVPDVPYLRKIWKEMGGVAATGVLLRQLTSKFFLLTIFLSIGRFAMTFIQDVWSTEKEYKDWPDDTLMQQLFILFHRMYRAIDWASWKVTSPVVWIVNLACQAILGSSAGGREDFIRIIKDYITGGDETKIPNLDEWKKKFPSDWFDKDKVISRIDTMIKKGEDKQDSLLKGKDIDITDLVPQDSINAVKIDTEDKSEKLDTSKIKIPDFRKNIK